MHEIVAVGADVFEANRKLAEKNRRLFEKYGVRAFDIMGAIGSGKTTLILRASKLLAEMGYSVGAIAGDVAGDDDYRIFRHAGLVAENINTGKECHLDAHYISHALEKMDLSAIDVLFIENVGNLVCPADFPLGTEKRVVVVSVTEGEDMVRKHPVIFGTADIGVLNKVDLAHLMGVSIERIAEDYRRITGKEMIMTDAKSGKGIDIFIEHLLGRKQ
ncbi:MAG: hydrogenase accessory protein HypB [Thermoplasmata archaeon]|nr:MAG: hydrogenase accessory protein HypB [Thermoplasmata archaeon]